MQRAWDSVRTMSTSQRLLDNAVDEEECARLLVVTTREYGAWLRALPLGLRMDDSTVRVAVGLQLGTRVYGAHTCQHCYAEVSDLGRHSLRCKKSVGRFQRHAALNDILKYALSAVRVPSRLEPTDLLRTEARWCDLGPVEVWPASSLGRDLPLHFHPLVQDRLKQHLSLGVWKTGKRINIETCPGVTGSARDHGLELVREVGRRIAMETGEPRSTDFLLQLLSVAVQRGNCASVLGGMNA